MSWRTLQEQDPDLAAFGAERLNGTVAYLATTRKDGAPRLHPMTPIIGAGRLFVFMEPTSPKGHDLQRDGRYAIHCGVSDNSGASGEFYISGRAHLTIDPEARALATRLASYTPADRYVLFEFDVEHAASTIYTSDGAVRRSWKLESATAQASQPRLTLQSSVWRQFGAAIDMLDNALRACPDELWQARLYDERAARPELAEFWYVAYHALFWLDFYLSDSAADFAPPAPFTLSELEAGVLPTRVYTKAELLGYLNYGRDKCRAKLETLTDAHMPQHVRPAWPDMSVAELHLYNMRHVQEHAAQLSLFLGQTADSAPGWVAKVGATGSGA